MLWGLLITLGLIVLAGVMAWWTMIRMPATSYRGQLPAADANLRRLADELRRYVAHLSVEIGERNLFNCPQGLERAADFIETEFAAAGYKVDRQEFQVSDYTCCNLEVETSGTGQSEGIVIVGAHYDTVVGTPGANDNASGVAAILALARRFSGRKVARPLRFVAFANEEMPYFRTEKMGSRVYARRCREQGKNVVVMLSLETIGYYDDTPESQKYPLPLGPLYPSEGNFITFVGNVRSSSLVRRVVGTFRKKENFPCQGGALPTAVSEIGFSDHWSFWQEGYPALMVTDTAMFRYPYYHQPQDTADKVDFERLARVVRGLEAVIAELVGVCQEERESNP